MGKEDRGIDRLRKEGDAPGGMMIDWIVLGVSPSCVFPCQLACGLVFAIGVIKIWTNIWAKSLHSVVSFHHLCILCGFGDNKEIHICFSV